MVNEIDQLKDRIDQAIIKRASDKGVRDYMGASGLGKECDRELWYSYHQPKPILEPRINRIFDLGNLIEDYLVKLLRDAGYTIHTHDDTGKQFGFIDMPLAGSIDGVLELNEPHLAEFKSYNTTRFTALKKSGVKANDPTYFTQVQVYMKEMELDKCMFIALNKNDCELYFEVIEYDPIESNWAKNRGHEIAVNKDILTVPRKYNHISSFKCKMCSYREQCWKVDKMEGEE